MGLSDEEQKKSQEVRLQVNGERYVEGRGATQRQVNEVKTIACRSHSEDVSCCQENGSASCCQNPVLPENVDDIDASDRTVKLTPQKEKGNKKLTSQANNGKVAYRHKVRSTPTWFESWEREDTYAALAVVCAAVSVAIAYRCYKQLS